MQIPAGLHRRPIPAPPTGAGVARWLLCAIYLAPLLWTGCKKSEPTVPTSPAETTPQAPSSEVPSPAEPAPPPQAPVLNIPYKKLDVARLFNGIQVKTSLNVEFGGTATAERQDPSSYELELQMRVKVPKPHQSLGELQKLNPDLGWVLPDLGSLLQNAKVSPLYEELYERKVASLQNNLSHLETLLSRHNFFDIETILELESPLTHRKALLLQSDMDVDTDGSDGDRVSTMDVSSSTFQPFTSYRWQKRTQKPNPFLAVWEKKLKDTDKDLGSPNLNAARQKELLDLKASLKQQIIDLKKQSFLVGQVDPYVVLPLPLVARKEGQPAARIGDYCVLIRGNQLWPAIVGDAGPSYKMGEASLRLCREMNARSASNWRAESDLKVTYLVFPGTAESPRSVPALEKWWMRCDALLGELGGYRGELAFLEDVTKAKPAPPPWSPLFIGPSLEFYGPPCPW